MMPARFIYSLPDEYYGVKVIGHNYTTSWLYNEPVFSGNKPSFKKVQHLIRHESKEENKIETKLEGGGLHRRLDKHKLYSRLLKGKGLIKL